jgi:hypothetical protein
MKLFRKDPPRTYEAGFDIKVVMSDCGAIELEPDEQVTFTTNSGGEYDVARKSWGFYATPSLNGRLRDFGFKAVLVKNRSGRYFVLLVEEGKENAFQDYAAREPLEVVCWLNDEKVLQELEKSMKRP